MADPMNVDGGPTQSAAAKVFSIHRELALDRGPDAGITATVTPKYLGD